MAVPWRQTQPRRISARPGSSLVSNALLYPCVSIRGQSLRPIDFGPNEFRQTTNKARAFVVSFDSLGSWVLPATCERSLKPKAMAVAALSCELRAWGTFRLSSGVNRFFVIRGSALPSVGIISLPDPWSATWTFSNLNPLNAIATAPNAGSMPFGAHRAMQRSTACRRTAPPEATRVAFDAPPAGWRPQSVRDRSRLGWGNVTMLRDETETPPERLWPADTTPRRLAKHLEWR